MLLLPGIGCVHVSGEQEVEPMSATAPMPDCVGAAGIDQRQIGFHAGAAHARDEILRYADLAPRRTADVHQVHEQRAQVLAADVADGFVKTGMEHTHSYTKPSRRFTAGEWPMRPIVDCVIIRFLPATGSSKTIVDPAPARP